MISHKYKKKVFNTIYTWWTPFNLIKSWVSIILRTNNVYVGEKQLLQIVLEFIFDFVVEVCLIPRGVSISLIPRSYRT